MDEGRSRGAAYNRDVLGLFFEEMYQIESKPLTPLDGSSDVSKHMYRRGRLIFQAQSADFQLQRCADFGDHEGEGEDDDGSNPADGREMIKIVGHDGVLAGLMEMDATWVQHNIPSAPRGTAEKMHDSAEVTSDEKHCHFIGLSAGRFPFSWRWEGRVPNEGRDLSASPVVNVMLIKWHGKAARRCGIGEIFVAQWQATEYKPIILE